MSILALTNVSVYCIGNFSWRDGSELSYTNWKAGALASNTDILNCVAIYAQGFWEGISAIWKHKPFRAAFLSSLFANMVFGLTITMQIYFGTFYFGTF